MTSEDVGDDRSVGRDSLTQKDSRDERAGARLALLVVECDPRCDIDRLGHWFEAEGVNLHTVRPYADEQLPPTKQIDGVIVLGGGMGAYEDDGHAWLEDARSLMREAHAEEIPVLGLCLGGQLLAQAHGGEVRLGEAGFESGLSAISWTDEAQRDPLLGDLPEPSRFVSFHRDEIVRLPAGARWLGTGEMYRHQAYRVGQTSWGLQFHPEADPVRLREWNEIAKESGEVPDDLLEAQARDFDAHDVVVEANARRLTDNFVRLMRRQR